MSVGGSIRSVQTGLLASECSVHSEKVALSHGYLWFHSHPTEDIWLAALVY